MGIRDGTIVFGLLNPEGLSSAPELSPAMKALYDRKDLYAFFNLDMAAVRSALLSLLNPEGPFAPLLMEMDMAEELPWILEGLKLTAEIDSLNIRAAAAARADSLSSSTCRAWRFCSSPSAPTRARRTASCRPTMRRT